MGASLRPEISLAPPRPPPISPTRAATSAFCASPHPRAGRSESGIVERRRRCIVTKVHFVSQRSESK